MKILLRSLTPRYYNPKKGWLAYADFNLDMVEGKIKLKGFRVLWTIEKRLVVNYPMLPCKETKEPYTSFMWEDLGISREFLKACRDEIMEAWHPDKWIKDVRYYYLNQGIGRKKS